MVKIEPIYNILDYRNIFFNKDGNISSHYKLLEEYLEFIEQSVMQYRQNFVSLENLATIQTPKLEDKIHKKLYGLYDLDNTVIESLKSEIKKYHKSQPQTLNGLKCVYCGIKRQEAEDLDHYLPRSIFPAYSILSYNLIFVCKKCNQDLKKSLFVEKNGTRSIINPYFDDIEKFNFLKCNLDFKKETSFTINYEVIHPAELTDGKLLEIVKNHFKNLDLNNRYINIIYNDCWIEFINVFTTIDKLGNKYFKGNIDQYNMMIELKIEALSTSHPSDFEKLFWEKLKENQNWLSKLPNRNLITGEIIET